MKVKKVILKTYYCLDGDYSVFEYNPLHNQEYKDVNVVISKKKKVMCGIQFVMDVVTIEGQEPIECELVNKYTMIDGTMVIGLCQDWG